ncbi:haloacid dehalogenase-like hydrolase [Seiridium cupressi]
MSSNSQPKVILFDIGGVVVVSPFQAILDYELSLGIPPGWINYSISKTSPNGFWHKLERGEIPMDDSYFDGFSKDLHDPVRWQAFYKIQQDKDQNLPRDIPPLPTLDAKWLFNEMMTGSAGPDPWMYPALKKLKESGRYIVAAVSNTVIFPRGHPLHQEDYFSGPVRGLFDVFVSSAHVGLRKPDPAIYNYTLNQVNKHALQRAQGQAGELSSLGNDVRPGDVVFLDDIGENLKAARKLGFRTIKVNLGRAFEAVDELERVTGLKLAGNHPRIPIEPRFSHGPARARI